jgi:hypothetical protein
MKVTWEGRSSDSRGVLKMDSGTMGMTALLIHLLVDAERQGLMDVARVRSYESFIRQRVSHMITNTLGDLGGFGVPVLEVEKLHALHPRVREEVRETQEGAALVRKDLKILIRTGWVHCGED